MSQYRIPVESTFSWQRPVISIQDIPPENLATPEVPAKGDRYIVGTGTDAWVGKDGNIAWYDGTVWQFDIPSEGWIAYVKDIDVYYRVNNAGVWQEYELHSHANKAILDLIEEALTTSLKTAYDDAVAKAHEHANKATLDAIEEAFTTALKTAYDSAVSLSHSHANKAILDAVEEAFTTALKTKLDGIEALAVSLATVKADADVADAIDKKHAHTNKAVLDSIEVALTSVLKVQYDLAYARRGVYDADLGCIVMDID